VIFLDAEEKRGLAEENRRSVCAKEAGGYSYLWCRRVFQLNHARGMELHHS